MMHHLSVDLRRICLHGILSGAIALTTLPHVALSDEDIDDLYGGGTDVEEFEFERFTNESILLRIDQAAKIACKPNGLCTLTATTERDRYFKVSFEIGRERENGSGRNNGYGGGSYGGGSYGGGSYGGGSSGNSGSSSSSENPDTWSNRREMKFKIEFLNRRCTQEIQVPRGLYYAMNRYLYGLLNEDGSPRREFTPADQSMILFYSTIATKATGCGPI